MRTFRTNLDALDALFRITQDAKMTAQEHGEAAQLFMALEKDLVELNQLRAEKKGTDDART